MTSEWARYRLKSPASRLFIQPFIQTQIKENIKAPRHWPLCGEFTGTGEFPAQRASYAENVSIWWRHHETKTIQVCWRQRRLSLWRPPLSLVKMIKAVIMIILQFSGEHQYTQCITLGRFAEKRIKTLTHCGLNKMAFTDFTKKRFYRGLFQMHLRNYKPGVLSNFLWSLFPGDYLTINRHWFR